MSALCVAGGNAFYDRIAAAASETLQLTGNACIELTFCDADEIRALNRETRGIDKATDVLSFPSLALQAGQYAPFTPQRYPLDTDPISGAVLLGSIVICEQIACEQAREYGHGETREKGYLFLHGVLHLLGFDHIDEQDRARMRATEEQILLALDIRREE